jgi:DNA-binding NtrC family response regulator
VVTIHLPPLRERTGDIPLLADYFLSRFAVEMGMNNPGITREAVSVLSSYPWPGNVRELANTLQKCLIFNRGMPINPEIISQAVSSQMPVGGSGVGNSDEVIRQWLREKIMSEPADGLFDKCLDRFGRILVSEALNLTGGNRSQSAKLLGLSRPTLHSKIEKYGLKFETSVKEE